MGAPQKAKTSKGPSHEELRQSYRSEEERRLCEDIERGRWAPDSYLKGWFEYVDESLCSESGGQSKFQSDLHWSDEE
jgi:hypothetical protein